MHLLGVDTGGTFTDFVVLAPSGDISIHKVLSTPSAPEQAILQGVAELGLSELARRGELVVVHGSTVATNAALEGKGVRTAYITNRGFADTLSIGRQTRRELYNLSPIAQPAPVARELCLETGGRIAADGTTLEPLTDEDIAALITQLKALKPEAVAINLLFSFLDDCHERCIEQALLEQLTPAPFISRSSRVLPEYKEYERGMATWLNSWLGPLVQRYLQRLKQALAPAPVAVMQSSGGTIDAEQASHRAVNMLLSGPAGGLAAASYIGSLIDSKRLLTFDMGGTSTDVALIDGAVRLTTEGVIERYPVAVPMVDMHTIGAGGGSIAWLDQGGLLQVGPQSAGAAPGPACYGQGGTQATVTDANAVLGRLRPDAFLGGGMTLDLDAARAAIARLAQPLGMSIEQTANGILAIANEHMTRALRVISVQQGHDPSDFQLCCFGGAGGLHICSLAEALGVVRALVPVHGGVLSALGMLVAPRQRQMSRTAQHLLATADACAIDAIAAELSRDGIAQLQAERASDEASIERRVSLDLRYQGQSYTLNVAWQGEGKQTVDDVIEAFHCAHEQRFGHRMALPVERVNVRVALNASSHRPQLPRLTLQQHASPSYAPLYGMGEVAVYRREKLAVGQTIVGPALVTEQVSTTLVASGWQATVDGYGNLLLEQAAR